MTDTPTHLPPQNLWAEEAILGSMLLTFRAIEAAHDLGLRSRHFYRDSHRLIHEAILAVHDRGDGVDELTVRDELTRRKQIDAVGGPVALISLAERAPAAANAKAYAQEVIDHALLRALVDTGHAVAKMGYEPDSDPSSLVNRAGELIAGIADGADTLEGPEALDEAFPALYDQWADRSASGAHMAGLPTGFRDLDALTGGLLRQAVVIVAARPGMGKTSFAMNVARNVVLGSGAHCMVFSMEMSRDAVVTRFMADLASVNSQRLMTGTPTQGDLERLAKAGSDFAATAKHRLLIDERGGLTPFQIRTKCRRMKRRLASRGEKLGLVLIDYLQLMEAGVRTENQNVKVSAISSQLTAMAKELDVPVMVLSQLNRDLEKRDDKRPKLSDLRDSGSIEQDASQVFFLYRPDYYTSAAAAKTGQAELIVAKNRNGSTGDLDLEWVPEFTRFEDAREGRVA